MNRLKKLPWLTIRLIGILALGMFLFSFTKKRHERKKIEQIPIEIVHNETLLITENMVNKLLIENNLHVSKMLKEKVDLNKLEVLCVKHPMLLESNIYKTIDGKLVVKVRQKKPIARFQVPGEVCYVSNDATVIPLSEVASARVPMVVGDKSLVWNKEMVEMLDYIANDSFLKQHITAVKIESEQQIYLQNRHFDFVVEFGSWHQYQDKLLKYKAFILKAGEEKSLEMFEKINLKFQQQVVCTNKTEYGT